MKLFACAALAALLCSATARADGPAPAPSTKAAAPSGAAKKTAAGGAAKKPSGDKAPKGAPKPPVGEKDAPCEPVKPCPIE